MEASESWTRRQLEWGELFGEARTQSRLSLERVASEVGVAPTTITNWRRAQSKLDPAFLDPLARAVGASTLEWAAVLGFVPPYLLSIGRSTESTKRELIAVRRRLQVFQEAGSATAAVVEAALRSGSWRAEVEGLVEGPERCRLRTIDHVIMGRADGQPTTAEDIRKDPDLDEALSAAAAIRLTDESWLEGSMSDARYSSSARHKWVWRIARLNAQQERALDACPLSTSTLAVVSPFAQAGPTDTAQLVGLSLGFGTVNTPLEARLRVGTFDDDLAADTVNLKHRIIANLATDLLLDRYNDLRSTIWSYATSRPDPTFLETLASERSAATVVYIRPTDAFIAARSKKSRVFDPVAPWAQLRDRFDEAIAARTGPTLVYEAGWPSDLEPEGLSERVRRSAAYECSILLALRVLRDLHRDFGGPALTSLHERSPDPFAKLAANMDLSSLDDRHLGLTPGRRYL